MRNPFYLPSVIVFRVGINYLVDVLPGVMFLEDTYHMIYGHLALLQLIVNLFQDLVGNYNSFKIYERVRFKDSRL